ncbi:hypothetical protein COOONC_22244 [Cooperia oncophora]
MFGQLAFFLLLSAYALSNPPKPEDKKAPALKPSSPNDKKASPLLKPSSPKDKKTPASSDASKPKNHRRVDTNALMARIFNFTKDDFYYIEGFYLRKDFPTVDFDGV